MTEIFFNPKELAQRWKISLSTLERWRWSGVGPTFIKIGGRIRYRQKEVDAYETIHGEGAIRQLDQQSMISDLGRLA